MQRIDRRRFDAAKFPIVTEVPTRFDDLDMQGHVNNAAAVAILQEARTRFNSAAGLPVLATSGFRVLVAALKVEYAAEMYHPAPVEISSGIIAIGGSSITIAQLARQNGISALYAQVVIVVTDNASPVSVPDEWRLAYKRLMVLDAG